MKNFITKKQVFYILGILLIFVVWFLASLIINNSGILPGITDVFSKLVLVLSKGDTYSVLGYTILKIFVTVFISFLIALVLAVVSLLNEKIEYLIRPFITIIRSVPIVAVVMILLILFFRQSSRFIGTMVATSFVVIPILYEAILLGFKSIDPWIIKSTRLENHSKFFVFRSIYLPLALPSILTGLISSFGMGLKVLVMSEVIMNPNNSLGQIISLYASYGELDVVLAYSLLLLVFVIFIDYLLKKISNKLYV